MRPFNLRHTTAAILAGLAAAVALSQTGCLRTQRGNADETAPGSESAPATRTSSGGESAQSDELQQPLLREFGEALDKAPDLGESDKNEAWKILREADPVLTRIKEENRKAIEEANRPPRIKRQGGKKPKPSGDAPEAEDQERPEA